MDEAGPPDPKSRAQEQPVADTESDRCSIDEHKGSTEEVLLGRILELQRQRDEGVWDKVRQEIFSSSCHALWSFSAANSGCG